MESVRVGTPAGQSLYHIIVYLVSAWDTFHRRPMLEALARNALGQAHVLLVNPMLSVLELSRARNKTQVRRLSENMALLTPVVWLPGAGRLPLLAHLRKRTLTAQIEDALRRTGPPDARRIEWVFRPEQLSRVGLARDSFVVYECYDEYTRSQHDGAPLPELAKQEDTLLTKAGLVLTTSDSLYRSRSARHPRVVYTPNGVDYDLFARARLPALPVAKELESIPGPRIGFVGNASETTLDYSLLEELAGRRPEWSLVLVGPAEDVSADTRRRLTGRGNVYFIGWVERRRLPSFLKGFDVALIPFSTHPWNAARNPLKLWEYMAAGRPAVATRIPEVEKYAEVVSIAESPSEFEAAVCAALEHPSPDRLRRGAELAQEHSWEHLTRQTLAEVLTAASAQRA
ncbi:MAG: glycosyltransferase [Chloroflexota bacterium]